MVDLAKLSAIHGSEAAANRARKRNAAQTRLKLYGIFAIFLAALALVGLLWTVLGNAAGALRENYVTLPITLTVEDIDPKGTADPDVIGKADFAGLTKAALRDYFPTVKARKDKRQLYDVVSSGAAFELREHVRANPELVGQKIDFRFLASDISDLYLKGFYGDLDEQDHSAPLAVEPSGKNKVTVQIEPEVLNATFVQIRAELEKQAKRIRAKAQLQDNGVREFERRLTIAETDDAKAEAQKQIEARSALRDQLNSEAEVLEQRAFATGSVTAEEKLDKSMPSVLLRVADTGWVKMTSLSSNGGTGEVLSPLDELQNPTTFASEDWKLFVNFEPEVSRKTSDKQIVWLESLRAEARVDDNWNWRFFSSGDSREPELAGIWGATVGSFLTMLVTFFIAFPVGVLAAIYLEEFAPKNKLTDFVEVNINNLAAVPSIVFGLLGLSIFLGVFGVPRSAPLAGGIVLALMTLPTIIIASRAAIRAVPPSIRDAALGLGASKLQTSFHHVLPLAMPGVLTGSIIGMAQALGETAPLIMIGMVAFIVDIPQGVTDSATVLPVQVFRWADFPERAFEARTAAAICVLLVFLVLMNLLAIVLRKRFERRW